MAETLLATRGLSKSFGALRVTDAVNFDVRASEIHALIGPNGAGKTSLIGQIFGEIEPDSGSILWRNTDIVRLPPERRVRLGLARTFQITSVLPEASVRDNVLLAALGRGRGEASWWRPAARDILAAQATDACLERTRLLSRAAIRASELSYGERRHLEIAMALVLEPQLLLLDEPMAGVGPDETQQLAELIAGLSHNCAILLVEHDMDVVFSLAHRVSVLVAGRVIASGLPEAVRQDGGVRTAYLGEDDAW